MESTEILGTKPASAPHLQANNLLDAVILSTAVVLPLSALFALLAFRAGAPGWGLAGLVVVGLAAIGIRARLVTPFVLHVRKLDIGQERDAAAQSLAGATQQRRPLKVVFFSDLHVGRVKGAAWTRRVVTLVNAQHPDAVLIGGDFIGQVHPDELLEMLEPLGELRAPLGVFAVLGNHDYGLPGRDRSVQLQSLFRQMNIRLLSNESVVLDGRVRLTGIDELWGGYADIRRAFDDGGTAEHEAGRHLRRIVLGHNPDLMAGMTEHADLFVFGHTHGGQIYLPFLERFTIPVDGDLYRGEYCLAQGRVYISSGCGETTTPTRLGTQVEIVVISVWP